jgi:hypothetical protein
MTNEQEIRVAAASILFRETEDITLDRLVQDDGSKGWEISLDHRDHLRALERYIRDGFDGGDRPRPNGLGEAAKKGTQ